MSQTPLGRADEFETRIQRVAEEHLAACNEWLWDDGPENRESPTFGPYDGCDTCVVREVLMSVWEDMLAEARLEAARVNEQDIWYLPGGAAVEEGRVIRLHPPPHWRKVELDISRVPPSMNSNAIRSHWRGFQEEKKSWQDEIEVLLMQQMLKRDGYVRAMAGGFLRFPLKRAVRDSGNFAGVLEKALGDALVNYRAIADDSAPQFYFGGVEFEPEPGPPRTRLWIYLQPKEAGQPTKEDV